MKIMNMKKTFTLLFLVLLLCICLFSSFSNKHVDVDSIISTRRRIDGHVCNFIIDGSSGAFNSSTNSFYYSINSIHSNTVSSFKIKSDLGFKYILLDSDILNYKDGKVLIYNKKYYQYIDIKFINIPIISIYDNDFNANYSIDKSFDKNLLDIKSNDDSSIFNSNEKKNMFLTIDLGARQNKYSITGDYHIRGGSSLLFEKKSYKVNLNKSVYLFDNEKSDEFVLDALYSDPSKIRNKFSSDLWNFINDNQSQNNDLYGSFTELYINDEYKGLYVIKNSVDKKFLGVSRDGFVAKPQTDFNEYFLNSLMSDYYHTNGAMVLNYELKYYYNLSDTYNLFLSKMRRLYQSKFDYNTVKDIFYLDNYVNYKLFITLIMGVDNVSKNYYISMKQANDNLLITPWDMDLSFGNNWDTNSSNGSSFYFKSYLDLDWIDSYLSRESDEVKKLISSRYKYLRNSKLTFEHIDEILDSYKETLLMSGAAQRDSDLWYEYDIDTEIETIRNWLDLRLAVLDNYFSTGDYAF